MKNISTTISSHPLLSELNSALLRTVEFIDVEEQLGEWQDTEQIVLPLFLIRSLKAQFKSSKDYGAKDVLIGKLIPDPVIRSQFCIDVNRLMLAMADQWKLEMDGNQEKSIFLKLAAASNHSEITKQQLLVGSPVLGMPLTGGGHFVHSTIPSEFAIDINICKSLGTKFRDRFSTIRRTEFTVPASTSQGLILKSKQDSPQWRVYSKALMAELASRAKSRADYDGFIEKLNEPFQDRGFHGPANDFYLGMRKQASRREEPVCSENSYSLTGDYGTKKTIAVQGRLRGIFPPSEFLKIFFKPFAEGIKDSLFKHSACAMVDLSYISAKLHIIAYNTFFHDLYDESGKLYCFYDLDKMDTTTHKGFFNIYKAFCEGVFPDFIHIEGDMIETSGMIFPPSIYRDDVFRQNIGGRSTLSGQPDVTTKNNICHLLAMSYSIGQVLNQPMEQVFEALLEGDVPLNNGIVPLVHVHGDDTMMFFSEKKEDYKNYYSILASQGFETSCENSPVFLKKTLCSWDTPSNNVSQDIYLDICKRIFIAKEADRASDCSSYLSELFSIYGVDPVTSVYNKQYIGFMNPIAGSLVRNRFGEYEVKDIHLLLMALSDTAKMLDAIVTKEIKEYWFLLYVTASGSETIDFVNVSSAEEFFSSIQSDDVTLLIREKLIELSQDSITKADIIKKTLEKMYYSSGEDLHDEFLQTMFGSLFITNTDLSTSFDLRTILTSDLIDLIQIGRAHV